MQSACAAVVAAVAVAAVVAVVAAAVAVVEAAMRPRSGHDCAWEGDEKETAL